MARLRRYRWLAALLGLAGIATAYAGYSAYAAHRPVAPGPWLQDVQQRGTLVVGVRQYARPAPPKAPTPPEPDQFDVAMARYVAERLGVTLKVVGLPGEPGSPVWQAAQRDVDVVIAGARPTQTDESVAHVGPAYAIGDGSLLVLRGSRYQRPGDLRGQPVCVGQGSAYATRIAQDFEGVPKVYASSIRAATGFLAGECQALADDAPVVARLLTLQEWRFYRRLDGDLQADAGAARIGLHAADPQSAAWFDQTTRDWRNNGALQRAREQRAGDVAYEASQLQDGLVCHS